MNAQQGLAKVERLVLPASALVTFAGDDIKMIAAGDWNGVLAMEGNYLKEWHPPTLLGVTNALRGSLGSGAMVALTGWAAQEAGKILGSGTIGEIGGVLKSGGKGVMIGGLADMIVRPTKYNPGPGHAKEAGRLGGGMGDPVMRKPAYYEPVGKPKQNAAVRFR